MSPVDERILKGFRLLGLESEETRRNFRFKRFSWEEPKSPESDFIVVLSDSVETIPDIEVSAEGECDAKLDGSACGDSC
jgi:hypothetical protein